MHKQKQSSFGSDSRKKMANIYEQEEAISRAFQVDNFYSNERLNIQELKQRLELFKKNKNKQVQTKAQGKVDAPLSSSPMPSSQLPSVDANSQKLESQSTAKFLLPSQEIERPIDPGMLNRVKARLSYNHQIANNTIDQAYKNKEPEQEERFSTIEQKKDSKLINYRIIKEVKKGRYNSKIKSAYGGRNSPLLNQSKLHNRVLSKLQKHKGHNNNKTDYSNVSEHSTRNNIDQWGLQGRIRLQRISQVQQLQQNLHALWQHYQLLTNILMGLKVGSVQYKNAIVKYVEDVCTKRFQFIKEVIEEMHRQETPNRKGEIAFLKRLKRNVILSRLLENLSIVYTNVEICLKIQPDSNLVNFIGYCCSNVIFVLRLIQLVHTFQAPLKFSAATEDILSVIQQFQMGTYNAKMTRMSEIYMRMQHNNEVIGIVQTRLCFKMQKQFQQIIVTFLKNVDLQSKPLLQYSHYIYQFQAFHLAKLKIVGVFSFVEMAPYPYLNLPKQKTLVIQPWQVLFANKNNSTYIRAYTQTLLKQVGKYWNIVYWTDLMPSQIDDLIYKLPSAPVLYRYHCRYENDVFLKLLWRIGCDVDNTIIIDRSVANIKYDREMGVQFPWHGHKKDSKLLQFLSIIHPLLFNSTTPLKKSFPPLRGQIQALQKKTSKKKRILDINTSTDEHESAYPMKLKGSRHTHYQY